MREFNIETRSSSGMTDITGNVQKIIDESRFGDGICCVFVPHTTAAVTINENADPDVVTDLLRGLSVIAPLKANYLHREGNSAAHIKASLIGASAMVIVKSGRLMLGTWQSIFFCEFDGPRRRSVWVKLLSEESGTPGK